MNFTALLGPPGATPGERPYRTRSSVLSILSLALVILSPATSARPLDDPLVTVSLFRSALLDGDVGGALVLLAPEVLAYQDGREQISRDGYAKNQLKKDIAHLAAYYVEPRNQKHDVQDNLAWVSTRVRLLGKSTEKPVEHFGTETVILRRSISSWLIVHRHWSDSALADDGG